MNFLIPKYNISLDLSENTVNVITIENPSAYTEIMEDIWNQCEGDEGECILSELDKEIELNQHAECIFNPFILNCNNKKVLLKLYQEISESLDGECFTDVEQRLALFMDEIAAISRYQIDYNPELNLSGLLKLYNVSIAQENNTLIDRVIEYLRVERELCGKDLFFMVNLKQYFEEAELIEIYKSCFYQKISLVIIETSQSKHLEEERHIILDHDLCLITPGN